MLQYFGLHNWITTEHYTSVVSLASFTELLQQFCSGMVQPGLAAIFALVTPAVFLSFQDSLKNFNLLFQLIYANALDILLLIIKFSKDNSYREADHSQKQLRSLYQKFIQHLVFPKLDNMKAPCPVCHLSLLFSAMIFERQFLQYCTQHKQNT